MEEKTTSQSKKEETVKYSEKTEKSEQEKILQAAKEILKTYEKAFLELAK